MITHKNNTNKKLLSLGSSLSIFCQDLDLVVLKRCIDKFRSDKCNINKMLEKYWKIKPPPAGTIIPSKGYLPEIVNVLHKRRHKEDFFVNQVSEENVAFE